jgi:hypothetical protein
MNSTLDVLLARKSIRAYEERPIPEEVKAQIKAAEEQGYDEWLLWDPSLNYTAGALRGQSG